MIKTILLSFVLLVVIICFAGGSLGFLGGLIGGLVGLVTGVVGAAVGLVAGLFGALFAIAAGLIGALLPLLFLFVIVAGVVQLIKLI